MSGDDGRIPVVFGGAIGAGDVVVTDGVVAAPDGVAVVRLGVVSEPLHGVGCLCCAPRGAAAEVLGRLFVERARGEVGFFSRVVVVGSAGTVAAVRRAVATDGVCAGRYRLT